MKAKLLQLFYSSLRLALFKLALEPIPKTTALIDILMGLGTKGL